MKPLRIVFAGTPDFAAVHLQALLEAGHQVVAVLTQPDRPAGRGKKLQPGPVKALAQRHGLPVLQPDSLKGDGIRNELSALAPDVMVVVAYGLIVPPAVLDLPRHGCINVHGSLLPRWRGAAPIQRAIVAGDTATGVTVMQMEAGLDTGPMLLKRETPIAPEDTGGSLHDRLAELGADALTEVLEDLPGHLAQAQPQPEEGVSYAHKLEKREARLDWTQPAAVLERQVRAFNPWPVSWTPFGGGPLRVWAARTVDHQGAPGEIIRADDEGLLVACGEGALLITRLQLPGKKAMDLSELLRGRAGLFPPGKRLDDD